MTLTLFLKSTGSYNYEEALSAFYLWNLDGQLLVKLAQIHHREDLKKLSNFHDLDLIFKVTRVI